jgi:N-acetylglucosamine-6-phosphate deacetylase
VPTTHLVRLDADAAVLPRGLVAPASVLIDELAGTIVASGEPAELGDGSVRTERVRGTLVPGFVELQVNGAAGHDFRSPDASGAARALTAILHTGVTTCCPTMPTQPAERYLAALAGISTAISATRVAPRVPGVHLEGPFLAEAQRGAHRADWLQAPSADLVARVLRDGALPVAIWTLAPELPGALEVVAALAASGVVVSAGHTAADDAALDAAVDQGLSMVTHLGNAMPPFHHRRPGPVGWTLAHPSVRAGLVLDGHHLHPTVIALFRALLGARAFGVTDAVATLGLPPGRYELSGQVLDTTTGVTRLDGPEGTIAGATIGTDQMIAALCTRPADLVDLVRLCSTSPADALGRRDLGRIVSGAAADLLLLAAEGNVARIWLAGRALEPSGSE